MHDKTAALDALPSVKANMPDRQSAKATGTDDMTATPPTDRLQPS